MNAEPYDYDEPRGQCPRCTSGDVQHLMIGMPETLEATQGSPSWVTWVGCVHPGHDRECGACGHQWPAPRLSVHFALGERVESKGRTLKVTSLDLEVLPRIREVLIDVARKRGTITYGELIERATLTHPPNGVGRLMDLISADCIDDAEPSLAAIVVNSSTGEVSDAFVGNAARERRLVYEFWATSP